METIYNGHSNKSGVYAIRNKLNGRVYIGSTFSFKIRLSQHSKSLCNGTHHNKFLQNDWIKCGQHAFTFEVLEVVEGEQADRLLAEQKYIDMHYDNQEECYNFKIQAKAESRSCFSKTPEKTREKLSKVQKALWADPVEREKRIEGTDGKRRENISKSAKATYEKMTSEEKNELSKKRKEVSQRCWNDDEYKKSVTKKLKKPKPSLGVTLKKKYKENSQYRKTLLANLEKSKQVPKIYKTYQFINPTGQLVEIINLPQFCIDNDLNYSCMRCVVNKRQIIHKGWSLSKK